MKSAGEQAAECLERIGAAIGDGGLASPVDGSAMPGCPWSKEADVSAAIASAETAFAHWRSVPAPVRGGLVRRLGEALRTHKQHLGMLVTLEAGKPVSEALGEVQEMIDICEFAVGLSRQLYGLTIVSERPDHHMREAWHPLGPVAIISAFNFPVAVWAWNAALALVCGNPVIWKPSEKTPLTALAVQAILEAVLADYDNAPGGLASLVLGGSEIGEMLVDDPRIALVSATGSTKMGREVGARVARRFGRSLLELGGNAAAIVTPSADLDLAVRAIAFSAAGTAGQRCTTLRRLIVHADVYDNLIPRLKAAYDSFAIGDPRDANTLIGPMIDARAVAAMQTALGRIGDEGGAVHGGDPIESCYVRPAIAEMPSQSTIVREETFAPILYVMRYAEFDEAIAMLRDVPQGLSSAILTIDLREAERFLSATGSDCGIANVNMGSSGAEIGGAFGGEKETGGGRESGSDAWRNYMRRQTQNINYGRELPLAQGVAFDF